MFYDIIFTETFVIGEIMNNNKRIVLFGGSFNPPTIAHYEIIKYLNDHYDEVLILPNGDSYTFAGKVKSYMSSGEQLFSVGCDLTCDLNSILWLGWPCSIGVTYSYNGGPSFNTLKTATGIKMGRHFVGPTFNVSF